MGSFNDDVTKAKTWATGHIVLVVIIGVIVGFLVRSII